MYMLRVGFNILQVNRKILHHRLNYNYKVLCNFSLNNYSCALFNNNCKRFFCKDKQPTSRVMTIPNIICMARICATPLICYIITLKQYPLASLLFIIAGISDLFDGIIARNVPHQLSKLGAIIDPLADKFLVNSVCLTLTYMKMIPIYVTALIFLRDIGIMSYIGYTKLNSPNKVIKFTPTYLSKCNTALQLATISLSLFEPLFGFGKTPYMQALYILTAISTLASGVQYFNMRHTFLKYK